MRGCTELATVPRIKVQLTKTQAKCQLLQQNSPTVRKKAEEMKHASPSFAPIPIIYKVFSSVLVNETEDYAQLRGSPG